MNNKVLNTQIQNKNIPNGVKKMNNKINTYSQSFYEMLNKIVKRAELEVTEYGDFAPIYEYFKNTNPDLNIDKYQLKIFKMPKINVEDETKRFIMAEVYLPSRDYKADIILGSGNKEEILKQLKSPDFVDKLNNAYIQLVDILQNP